MKRKAEIFFGNQFAGMLEETDDDYIFTYSEQYLSNSANLPISLTLPLRKEAYHSKRLFPFFDGLIPEGWLLNIFEKNWKINPRDRMGLLLVACRDCIGAVSVIPMEEEK